MADRMLVCVTIRPMLMATAVVYALGIWYIELYFEEILMLVSRENAPHLVIN